MKDIVLHTAMLCDGIDLKSIPGHSVIANLPINCFSILHNRQTHRMWKDCSSLKTDMTESEHTALFEEIVSTVLQFFYQNG